MSQWTYYDTLPTDRLGSGVRCEWCGECDCRGDERSLMLCQTVGECSGIYYDTHIHRDGTIICNNCFETEVDFNHDWVDYDPYPHPGKITAICTQCKMLIEETYDTRFEEKCPDVSDS